MDAVVSVKDESLWRYAVKCGRSVHLAMVESCHFGEETAISHPDYEDPVHLRAIHLAQGDCDLVLVGLQSQGRDHLVSTAMGVRFHKHCVLGVQVNARKDADTCLAALNKLRALRGSTSE